MCNHFAIANCGDQVSENAVAFSIRDSQGYFEFTTDMYLQDNDIRSYKTPNKACRHNDAA